MQVYMCDRCGCHFESKKVVHLGGITVVGDFCPECIRSLEKWVEMKDEDVLDKICDEIKEWYWQVNKQALAKDPCVVDSMIDLFIRTVNRHKAENEKYERAVKVWNTYLDKRDDVPRTIASGREISESFIDDIEAIKDLLPQEESEGEE